MTDHAFAFTPATRDDIALKLMLSAVATTGLLRAIEISGRAKHQTMSQAVAEWAFEQADDFLTVRARHHEAAVFSAAQEFQKDVETMLDAGSAALQGPSMEAFRTNLRDVVKKFKDAVKGQ